MSKKKFDPHEYQEVIHRAIEESLRLVPLFDGYDHEFFFPRIEKVPPSARSAPSIVPSASAPPAAPARAPYGRSGFLVDENDEDGAADGEMKQAMEKSLSLEREKKSQIALEHLRGLLTSNLHLNPDFAPYYAKIEGCPGLTADVAHSMLYWKVIFEPTLGTWENFIASEHFLAMFSAFPFPRAQASRSFICTREMAQEIGLRQTQREERGRQVSQQSSRAGKPQAIQRTPSPPVLEEDEGEDDHDQQEEYDQGEYEQEGDPQEGYEQQQEEYEQEEDHDDFSLTPQGGDEFEEAPEEDHIQSSFGEEEETPDDIQNFPSQQQSTTSSRKEEQQIKQDSEKRLPRAASKNKNIKTGADLSALPPKNTAASSALPLTYILPEDDYDYEMIESDDVNGPIAEFDPTGGFPVAKAIPVTSASFDDGADAVLVDVHDLLSQSSILQFQQMLQNESEDYLQNLCAEHEKDELRSSVVFRRQPMVAVPISDPKSNQKSDPIGHVDGDTSSLTVTMVCPNAGVFDLLQNNQISFLRENGVKLFFTKSSLEVSFTSPDRHVLAITRGELERIMANPAVFRNRLKERQATRTHIFIDNSNIFLGAQIISINPRTKQYIYDRKVRLRVSTLHEIVNNGRKSITRHVCGSVPNTDKDAPWVEVFRRAKYKVNAIPIGVDGKEGGIDGSLIAEFYKQAFAACNSKEKNVLVLLTGDGNSNGGNASFFNAVKQAIAQGLYVELWCWRLSVNQNYRRLLDEMCDSGKFKLFFLDNYRDEIVFKSN